MILKTLSGEVGEEINLFYTLGTFISILLKEPGILPDEGFLITNGVSVIWDSRNTTISKWQEYNPSRFLREFFTYEYELHGEALIIQPIPKKLLK